MPADGLALLGAWPSGGPKMTKIMSVNVRNRQMKDLACFSSNSRDPFY